MTRGVTGKPAEYFAGGQTKFEPNGRRVGASLLIVQWQNGIPVTVYPAKGAASKPVWPKR